MGRYLKVLLGVVASGVLLISFQNCGRHQTGSNLIGDNDREVFVSFDENSNTPFKIQNTNCQESQCLFTLKYVGDSKDENQIQERDYYPYWHSTQAAPVEETLVDNDEETLERDYYPYVASPERDTFAENPEVIQVGLYCDILEKKPNGLIYVSCPEEVQSDLGFYLSF